MREKSNCYTMQTMTKAPLSTFLKQDSKTLGNLLLKLQQLNQWNAWLAECLADEKSLLTHCKIVGLDRQSLIVMATNPHWVTRFRFFIPTLIEKLRQFPDLKNIQAICCKVSPPQYNQVVKKPRGKLALSQGSSEVVQHTAKKIKHAKLKQVLERLAERKNSINT